MAEPLTIQFQADTSRAQAAMTSLAASVVGNMAQMAASMQGGTANSNTFGAALNGLVQNAQRAATAVGQDVSNISKATVAAATSDKATLEEIVRAFTRTAVTSNTAQATMRAGFAGTKTALGELFAQLPSLGGLLRGLLAFAAAKAAFDVISAAGHAAAEALERVAKVGDDASKLGVSTTFLQTYTAQARNLKVETDSLVKSLETAKAAFTVTQGEGGKDARNQSPFEGRLRQQVQAGNATDAQLSSFLGARGTEAQFRAALDIMIQLEAKGKQLAALDLASRIFPPEIVDRIRQGSIALDRLRVSMDDTKNPDLVLLKPEEIVRAQELQRRLDDANATLDKAGREFNRTLAAAGEQLKADAITWKETIAAGANLLLKATQAAQTSAKAYLDTAAGLSSGGKGVQPGQRTGSELGAGIFAVPTISEDERQRREALDRLRGNLGNKTLREQAQRASLALSDGIRKDPTNPLRHEKTREGGGSEATDPVQTFINGLEKSAAALQAETEAFAKSNAEKAVAIQLAKAREIAEQNGRKLTDEQAASIRKAATDASTYRDKLADLEQAQRQAAETARYFGDTLSNGLADAIVDGQKLGDVVSNVARTLERSAIQALITGQGPLASLFGTAPLASAGPNASGGLISHIPNLFRANGGDIQAGRPYTVGEMGRELFIPNQNGRMVPIERGPAGAGGGIGAVTHAPTYNVTPPAGTSPQQVAAMIARYDQQSQRTLVERVKSAQRRYG